MKTLKLTIRTPEKTIFDGRAQFVKLFTEQGLAKIFHNHASITGAIDFTPLAFADDEGNEEDYVLRRGTIMISNKKNRVDIMVFSCEKTAELNPTTAKEYLEFIEKELEKGSDLSDFQLQFYEEEKYVIKKEIKHIEK